MHACCLKDEMKEIQHNRSNPPLKQPPFLHSWGWETDSVSFCVGNNGTSSAGAVKGLSWVWGPGSPISLYARGLPCCCGRLLSLRTWHRRKLPALHGELVACVGSQTAREEVR